VTLPSSLQAGVYTLTATSGGEVLGVSTIRVVAAGTGGLPFTGADVGPGLAVGAGLIVAGGLLLLTVRRRRIALGAEEALAGMEALAAAGASRTERERLPE